MRIRLYVEQAKNLEFEITDEDGFFTIVDDDDDEEDGPDPAAGLGMDEE